MHAIGAMTLSSILELQEPFVDPFEFFPDASQDVLDRNKDWLYPRMIDPDTGKLIFAFQSFLVRTPNHTILIDSCIGNDKERPTRPTWHRRQGKFLQDLAALGVQPEEIDFVLCTHLHADHVGWNTRLLDGNWVPTFPNAKYVMARREFDFWENRYRLDPDNPRAPAFNDSVLPVVAANQALMVDMDHAIEDGVVLEPAPGHTPGSIIVSLKSNGHNAACLGDCIHHPIQLKRPDWSSMACEDKALSAETRTGLLNRFADTDTLMVPAHFPTPTIGHLTRSGDAFGYKMVG